MLRDIQDNCGVKGNRVLLCVLYGPRCMDVSVFVFIRNFIDCLTLTVILICFALVGRLFRE